MEVEDQARLQWMAQQFNCTQTEILSLLCTWLIRHVHAMMTFGMFGLKEFRRLQRMFPLTTIKMRVPQYQGGKLSGHLLQLFGVKYRGRPDLYEVARNELAKIFKMPPETIPQWILSLAIWGGYPPGQIGDKRLNVGKEK